MSSQINVFPVNKKS